MNELPLRALLSALPALLVGCGGGVESSPPTPARPVTLITLTHAAPPPATLLPGVVRPYREVAVGFEVGGRVISLLDVGETAEGEQLDSSGSVEQEATILAQLDSAPFERALKRAEQRLLSSEKQLEAQVVQLEVVLPAQLARARASAEAAELNASYAREDVEALESSVKLAETTLQRNRELLPGGAVSDITVRESQTELETRRARLAQARTLVSAREREHESALTAIAEVEGLIALQEAQNAASVAGIDELKEAVRDAESDLEKCTLRSPIPGRVTLTHVGEGSFVAPGSPIVTVTMMNPIEAVISVAGTTADDLVVGTDAIIYPTQQGRVHLERGVQATVYEKRGVADAGSRTFEIGLIAPNRRRSATRKRSDKPTVPYVIPLFENPFEIPGQDGLYTLADSVGGSGDDRWVYVVEGLKQGSRNADTLRGQLPTRRVAVTVDGAAIRIASFEMVHIDARGDLKAGDLIVPQPGPEHAGGVYVADNSWLLRPGDVVRVSAAHGELPSGFYVPVQSVRQRNDDTWVFVVDADGRAARVPVTVHESAGEKRRISATVLSEGDRIVVQGAHFLRDGDKVSPTEARP